MLTELFQQAANLQKFLQDLDLTFAFIGGIANAVHGQPRATLDADVLLLVPEKDLEAHLERFGKFARILAERPAEFALKTRVIPCELSDGLRVDLILAELQFEKGVLQRARAVPVLKDLILRICTAEDLVIMKLLSDRAKDREDARFIVLRQAERLDRTHILKCLRDFELALNRSDLIRDFEGLRSDSKP